MKELDGEDLQGLFTVLNKGEIFNESHLNNITAFSCLRNWAVYRLKNQDTDGKGIREYVLAYLMKIFEQIMRAYDSLVPIPELDNPEWVNFIEGVTCESLTILNLMIETDESILMKLIDPLQKLWKRVLKKQQGFSILCFLELVLNFNTTLLLDPDVLCKEFFESHLYTKVHDELLCLKTLNFLSRKSSLLKETTTIFQKYPRILFLIYIHNPSLYISYMEKILPFIVNDESLLAIFQLTIDLPLLCRLHTFDSFLQEKVLLIKSFDWLAPQYQQLIPYLNLQNQTLPLEDDYLNLLSKLYTETSSVIKENVLSGQLEALIKLVLSLIEDLENPESLMSTIKIILIRYEYLFFEKDLKKRIKKIFKDFIEKTLRANQDFLIKLSNDFIEYLNCHKNEEVQDLVMHLTWLISDIIPSSFILKPSSAEYKEWSMEAKSYCDHMEIILHQLIYFITLPVKTSHDENAKSGSTKTSAVRGRIDELVCLLLGAMMKISVKYPMLKQNIMLVHLKLFGRKEDLPNIVNSKVVTNLKLLKNSTTTLLLFGNCL